MTNRFVLNFNQQANGDYEVHKAGCLFFPSVNYYELGNFYWCKAAVEEAKIKHPHMKINGCYHCAPLCHSQ